MPAWNRRYKWNDTIISSYFSWVTSNYERFNDKPVLCNWFPIRLLVEFASCYGLRIRLRYWPGRAPISGGRRHWNYSKVLIHDSGSKRFSSKSGFYVTVKSKVTAQMIGVLNTEPISRAIAQVGDLIINDFSDAYWHAAVITRVTQTELVTQAGSKPKIIPRDNEKRIKGTMPRKTFGNSPRRWIFSQFDT